MLRMHALVHHTLRDFQSKQGRWSPSGRCTYDVCTEGEGGVTPKEDDGTDKLRECDGDKGERGSKHPKILRTSYVHAPSFSFPLRYDLVPTLGSSVTPRVLYIVFPAIPPATSKQFPQLSHSD